MTLFRMDRLPDARRLTPQECERVSGLSNKVYDALESFGLAEMRRNDMARVMVEAATKFLEKGL
jgi:hypothetical protein